MPTNSKLKELKSLIASWQLDALQDVQSETSLIRSGRLESSALFNLVLWIEQQTGKSINPAEIDLTREFDTLADILRFIKRETRV